MTNKQFGNYQAQAAAYDRMKFRGFQQVYLGKTDEERCEGMKKAIEGYYLREKQTLEEVGKVPPSPETYLIHFISAKKNYYKDEPLVHEAVQNLIAQYGTVEHPNFSENKRSWNPDK